MLHDYVYYIKIEGELVEDLIFESEALAREYAECAGYESYEIVEYDCE